jgi:septal ring factor EnvC (AmiA/AmiB activator)
MKYKWAKDLINESVTHLVKHLKGEALKYQHPAESVEPIEKALANRRIALSDALKEVTKDRAERGDHLRDADKEFKAMAAELADVEKQRDRWKSECKRLLHAAYQRIADDEAYIFELEEYISRQC